MAIEELIFNKLAYQLAYLSAVWKNTIYEYKYRSNYWSNQIQSIQAKGKLEFDTNPYDVVRW